MCIRRDHQVVLSLIVAGVWAEARGQVVIAGAHFREYGIEPRELFTVTVNVGTEPVLAAFTGRIDAMDGSSVVQWRSTPKALAIGTHTIRSSDLAFEQFMYGSSDRGRTAMLQHRLTAGSYRACLSVNLVSSAEPGDEYCDELMVEDMLFMDLIHPLDGDTIQEVRPTLSWWLSEPQLPPGQEARLILVPLNSVQIPAQALAIERPLFEIGAMQRTIVQYPPGYPSLMEGRCYAWQVERTMDNVIIDRTEPWSFCVARPEKARENKYVLLTSREDGSVYDALGQKIFFRFDEPYATSDLQCTIKGKGGRTYQPVVRPDGERSRSTRASGIGADGQEGSNLFVLDLQPLGLKKGYYDLVVRDGKERSYVLKFFVEP